MFALRKKQDRRKFNPAVERAVIVQSICTGERSLVFVDRETGKREQVGCIRGEDDLDSYVREYGLDREKIRREF